MFQFRRFPFRTYGFSTECPALLPDGFPHSGIHGSLPAFGYPWLFAACHVLHRLLMPRHSPCALISLILFRSYLRELSPIIGSLSWIMQALTSEVFSLAKIVFYPKKIIYPLLLPSHNCIIIHNVQFSRYIFEFQRNSMKLLYQETSVNFFVWWRVPGSNRWPPACKAGALPAELTPHI